MAFASVNPHYIAKAEKKGRTKEEVHAIIHWLTGYDLGDTRRGNRGSVDLRPDCGIGMELR
jgi:hypothetical protein